MVNEAEPKAFLEVVASRMPRAARMAEWCCGEEVNVVYHGRLMKSSIGGSRGAH